MELTVEVMPLELTYDTLDLAPVTFTYTLSEYTAPSLDTDPVDETKEPAVIEEQDPDFMPDGL